MAGPSTAMAGKPAYCGGVVVDPVPVPVLLPVPVPVVPVPLPLMLPEWSFDFTLHCSDSILTSVTLKVPLDQDSLPDELAAGEASASEEPLFSQVPLTATSWPTWAETSCPASATLPFFVMRTYRPLCDSTHPFSFFSLLAFVVPV